MHGHRAQLDVRVRAIAVAVQGEEQEPERDAEWIASHTLNLFGNELGPAGGRKVAAQIPSMAHLTALNLYRNGIQEDGALILAQQLPKLQRLEGLNLGGNDTGKCGRSCLPGGAVTATTVVAKAVRISKVRGEISSHASRLGKGGVCRKRAN